MAKRFIYTEKEPNYDSAFYYYDRALELEIGQFDEYSFIARAMVYGDYDRAKRYLLIGAAHGMTWKEAKYSMAWAKSFLDWPLGDPRLYETLNWKSKIQDVCLKEQFEAVYESNQRPKLNEGFMDVLKRADRINNKSRERVTEDLIERDYKVYYLLYQIVVWDVRLPTVDEVGTRGHGIIARVLKRCTATQILKLLPFLLEAIHEGTYLYNESLAEAINRCAIYDGEFIVLKEGNFVLEKDTLYGEEKWGNYSYLGLDYSLNKLDFVKERYVQPLRHANITVDQVNFMRDTLCLDSIQAYLELRNIKQLKPYLFEENMDSLNANK
jgi:hypothetical protein